MLSGVDALFLNEVLQPLHANQSFPKNFKIIFKVFLKNKKNSKGKLKVFLNP
jgi:hypothetical protein